MTMSRMPIIKRVRIIHSQILVPHRELHMKSIEKLKSDGQTKVLGAPFFPYDGCAIFIETEGDKKSVESFVESDPYIKNKIVSSYAIKEFDGSTVETKRRFERISGDFVYRS